MQYTPSLPGKKHNKFLILIREITQNDKQQDFLKNPRTLTLKTTNRFVIFHRKSLFLHLK